MSGSVHSRVRPRASWLHRLVRGLFPRERLVLCGRAVRYGASGVVVRRCASGRLAYSGLYRCGDFWRCPSCRTTIAYRRADQLQRALSQHVDAGGSVLFLTLTLPHSAGDSLPSLLSLLSQRWRRFSKVAFRAAFGDHYVGSVRTLEVVHGVNGWHPHYHVLVFVAAGVPFLTPGAVVLADKWREVSGDPGVMVDWRLVLAESVVPVARYVVEQSLYKAARELATPDTKVPRGRSYLDILWDYAYYRSSSDAALIFEYAAALHGVHHMTVSPALRRLYDFSDPARNWPGIPDEDVVALLDSGRWRDLVESREDLRYLDELAQSLADSEG